MEKPCSPVWLGAVDVTNKAPALLAVIPPDTVLSVAGCRLPLWVVMLTLLNMPALKMKDPLAVPPSANFTPARNHFCGVEAAIVAVADPAVMERLVPDGTVHPESEQSASSPVKVAVPAVPGSVGEKSS